MKQGISYFTLKYEINNTEQLSKIKKRNSGNKRMSISLEHSLAPFEQNRIDYGYFSKLPRDLLLLISAYYFGPIELSMYCEKQMDIVSMNCEKETTCLFRIKVFSPDGILQSICMFYLNPYELFKFYKQWPKGFAYRLPKTDSHIEVDTNFYTNVGSYISYYTEPKHQLEISLREKHNYTWIILDKYLTELFWEKLKCMIDTIDRYILTNKITHINFHEFIF